MPGMYHFSVYIMYSTVRDLEQSFDVDATVQIIASLQSLKVIR